MTNKEKYINSFSGVEPSEEIKERILNMTQKKKRYSFKALSVVFAVLILIATAMLTANAATDGAIGEKISEVSKEITEKISIMINGKEIEATFKYTPVSEENGKTGLIEVIIPDELYENKNSDDKVVFELNEVMDKFGKITLQMSEQSTEQAEFYMETETDNVIVILENE